MAPGEIRKHAAKVAAKFDSVTTPKGLEIQRLWRLNQWKNVIKAGDPEFYADFLAPAEPESEDTGSESADKDTGSEDQKGRMTFGKQS